MKASFKAFVGRWKPKTLRGTLILAFLPVSVLMTAAVGWIGYRTFGHHMEENIQGEIQHVADRTAESVDRLLRQGDHDLLTLADSPLIEDYANNQAYGLKQEAEVVRKDFEGYLEKFRARTGRYAALLYLNDRDRVVCRVGDVQPDASEMVEGRALVKTASSRPARSVIRGQWKGVGGTGVLWYASSLKSERGESRGALLLGMKGEVLEALLKAVRVGQTGSAALGASTTAKPFGSGLIGAVAPIDGGAWQVRVEAPLKEFLGPVESIRHVTISVIGLASLLVIGIVSLLVRRITRPVSVLAEAAGRVADGMWEFRAGSAGVEELDRLAIAFENMVVSLRQRSMGLQRKIGELSAMHQLSGAILNQVEQDEILRLSLESAIRGLDFERGALYVVDHEAGVVRGKFAYGVEQLSTEDIQRRVISLGSTDVLAEVVLTNRSVNIPNPAVDVRLNPNFVQVAETRGLCFVPIRTSRGVLGVIGADRQATGRVITDEDAQNLLTFANAMGLALEKAMLLGEIRTSEELSRSILESSEDAMVALDSAWRVTTWNRAAEQLFGFTREEMMGQPLHTVFGPPDAYREWWERLRQHGHDRQALAQWASKAGPDRKVEVSMTWASLKGDAGQVLGWAGVIRDLTRERQLHQTMVKTEKLSAMGQLIAGIAHELNNPLSVVSGYAQLLHGAALPEAARHDAERIYLAALRCQKLIQGLLMFARPTEGGRQLVDLHEPIESVLSLMGYELRKHDVTVAVRRARGPVWVHADPLQLEQVFVNLCQNACHAMASEGVAVRQLTLHVFTVGELAGVAVRDTGSGVPDDLREKIFEPFFTTKPHGEGTGLGLHLAREIALKHGGHLAYDAFDGEGAAFVLTMPSAPCGGIVGLTGEAPQPAIGARGCVLVVDDDVEVADLLERTLAARGHRVIKVHGVEQAERFLNLEEVDVVISDLELGGLTGYRFVERVVGRLGRHRVVVVTGNVLSDSARRFMEGLQVTWLPKPLELEELHREVERRLRERREAVSPRARSEDRA